MAMPLPMKSPVPIAPPRPIITICARERACFSPASRWMIPASSSMRFDAPEQPRPMNAAFPRRTRAAALAACAALAFGLAGAARADSYAIEHVTLIDGLGHAPQADM